jgi:hypothetical protein
MPGNGAPPGVIQLLGGLIPLGLVSCWTPSALGFELNLGGSKVVPPGELRVFVATLDGDGLRVDASQARMAGDPIWDAGVPAMAMGIGEDGSWVRLRAVGPEAGVKESGGGCRVAQVRFATDKTHSGALAPLVILATGSDPRERLSAAWLPAVGAAPGAAGSCAGTGPDAVASWTAERFPGCVFRDERPNEEYGKDLEVGWTGPAGRQSWHTAEGVSDGDEPTVTVPGDLLGVIELRRVGEAPNQPEHWPLFSASDFETWGYATLRVGTHGAAESAFRLSGLDTATPCLGPGGSFQPY